MFHYLQDDGVLLRLLEAAQKAVKHEDTGLSEEEDPITVDVVFSSNSTVYYRVNVDSTLAGESLAESIDLKVGNDHPHYSLAIYFWNGDIWDLYFEGMFRIDDPPADFGFQTEDSEKKIAEEIKKLWEILAEQLGSVRDELVEKLRQTTMFLNDYAENSDCRMGRGEYVESGEDDG